MITMGAEMALGKEQGVYYARDDHPGLVVRILIDVVDVAVALALSLLAASIAPDKNAAILCGMATWVLYFTVAKRAMRTVGYRAFGMKIVDLRGRSAPLWSLIVRLIFMMAGPLNYLADLLWMMSNGSRQALRDQFLGTYVVRARANPIGIGPIVWKTCYLMGYAFVVGEVARRAETPRLAGSANPTGTATT
jgi:uncharacterized RDD family membrane protein YckC